jgi:hypothetical protein
MQITTGEVPPTGNSTPGEYGEIGAALDKLQAGKDGEFPWIAVRDLTPERAKQLQSGLRSSSALNKMKRLGFTVTSKVLKSELKDVKTSVLWIKKFPVSQG